MSGNSWRPDSTESGRRRWRWLLVSAVLLVSGCGIALTPGSAITAGRPSAQPSTAGLLQRVIADSWLDAAPAPVPATQPAGRGSAIPGDTFYSVPSDAIVVSPAGNDAAAGSLQKPLRTVQAGLDRVGAGGTVVVRAGVFHESVVVPDDKPGVSLQAYPGEAVWFDGSRRVTNWQTAGRRWVHTGWRPRFDSSASYTPGVDDGFVDPAYPLAAHPDQVWIDGIAQRQVGAIADVTAGTFYLDEPTSRLYLGSDPTNKVVLASDLEKAFTSAAPNTTFRGIGVRRYGTPLPAMGAVRVTGAGSLIENVVSKDNATTGFSASSAPGIVFRNITAKKNGLMGVHANMADGIEILDSVIDNNNSERFAYTPASGGIKITRTQGVTVRGSSVSGNTTNGIWLDESVLAAQIIGNRVLNNGNNGVQAELSADVLVAGNVIANNAGEGIKIYDTSKAQIWNNTLVGNWRAINCYQDSRDPRSPQVPGRDPRQHYPTPSMTWQTGPITIANNIMVSGSPSDFAVLVDDGTGRRTAAQIGLTMDNNAYRVDTGRLAVLAGQDGNIGYDDVSAVRNAGYEVNGVELSSAAVSDSLRPTAQVVAAQETTAAELPVLVAAALDTPVQSRQLGAS